MAATLCRHPLRARSARTSARRSTRQNAARAAAVRGATAAACTCPGRSPRAALQRREAASPQLRRSLTRCRWVAPAASTCRRWRPPRPPPAPLAAAAASLSCYPTVSHRPRVALAGAGQAHGRAGRRRSPTPASSAGLRPPPRPSGTAPRVRGAPAVESLFFQALSTSLLAVRGRAEQAFRSLRSDVTGDKPHSTRVSGTSPPYHISARGHRTRLLYANRNHTNLCHRANQPKCQPHQPAMADITLQASQPGGRIVLCCSIIRRCKPSAPLWGWRCRRGSDRECFQGIAGLENLPKRPGNDSRSWHRGTGEHMAAACAWLAPPHRRT